MMVMLPCPGPGPMSWSTVLFVHPGRMTRVAPVLRIVTFMRVLLPYAGPVWIRQSIMLLVQSAREAPVMRPGRWRRFPRT